MKEREVINALLTIKEYCESITDCEHCMFSEKDTIGEFYDCILSSNVPSSLKVEVKVK